MTILGVAFLGVIAICNVLCGHFAVYHCTPEGGCVGVNTGGFTYGGAQRCGCKGYRASVLKAVR